MKKISKALIAFLFVLSITATSVFSAYAATNVPAVSSLKATSASHSSIKLTWKKLSGVTGYEVEQLSGKTWKVIKTGLTENSLTVKSLTTNKTYKFRVRAYKTTKSWFTGERTEYGSYSKTASAKPIPSKVNAKVASVTTTSAKLSWKKISGVTGYYIQQKVNKEWKKVATVNAKTTSYTITKLKLGNTYTYRVVAYKTVSKKNVTGTPSSTLTVKPAVAKPTGVKASNITASSATISWKKVSEAKGYQVQLKNGSKWKTVSTIKKNSTVKTTVSIVPGTTYEYRVRAYKTVSKKTYYSAAVSVKVSYTVPSATALKVSSVTKDAATLTWTAASGVSGYEVQMQNGSAWQKVASVKTTSATVSIVPNTSYSLRVVSFVTVSGKNYYGKETSAVSAKYTVPSATALKVSSITKDAVTLTWTAASGVSRYEVQMQNGSTWQKVASVKTTSATVSIIPNTNYSLRVVSFVTVSGKNYYGKETSAVSAKYTVSAASSLKASSVTKNSATLTWTAASGANGYEVQVQNGSAWQTVASVNTTTATVSIVPNTSYKYRVVAFATSNGKNYSAAASNEVSVKFSLGTPSNLKASSVKDTSVSLAWNGVSGADGYNIYQGNTLVTTSSSTSATVSSLNKGTSYTYTVKAFVKVNSNNYLSASSNAVTVKTAPDKVSGLSYTNLKENSATLNWSKVSGAEGYTVYKYNSSTKTFDSYKTVTATTLSVTSLTANTTYQFKVAAYHKANGSAVYGSQSDTVSFTTYFDTVEKLASNAISRSYENKYFEQLTWNKIEGATYEAYLSNTLSPNWVLVNANTGSNENSRTYFYHPISTADIGLKAEVKDSIKLNASWNAVSGASKYVVQTRTGGVYGSWTTQSETTSTTASFYVAPSTEYEIRVIVYNASFKVCAVKGSLKTDFAVLNNLPGVASNTVKVTSQAAPTFNKNDKTSKTAYVLKALQAINNTKAERNIKSFTKHDVISSEIDSLKIKYGIFTFDGTSIFDLAKALKNMGIISEDDYKDLTDMGDDLNEDSTYTGTVTSGMYVYNLNGSSEKKYANMYSSITPYEGNAYLYNASDINSIDSKISNVSYTKNSDGTETITFTIAKETATKSNDKTPVHAGIIQDYEGMASAEGIDDGKVTVGDSTVKVVINANGTLNSMETTSPFTMYTKVTSDGSTFSMNIKGNSKSTYSFER